MNSKSNNDTEPYKTWECTSLTEFLKQHGEVKTHIEILKAYEEGNFQSQIENRYTKALITLKRFPEYANFNLRLSDYSEKCLIHKSRQIFLSL